MKACLKIILLLSICSLVNAAPLNDTGQINFGDDTASSLSSEPSDYPKQDANFGRDAAMKAGILPKKGGGNAGFDFTKIANDGSELPASATNHACVRDNVTGLTWEVKTKDNGLHHNRWIYSWYSSDLNANGGNPGTANNGGRCFDSKNCDTEKFSSEVNKTNFCSFSDWRLPKFSELMSIVDSSKTSPSIDTNYFPNLVSGTYYFWSSTSEAFAIDGSGNNVGAGGSEFAYPVNFSDGNSGRAYKVQGFSVMLVRGGL